MRRIAAVSVFAVLSSLALAACKPAEEAPGGMDAPPPADAPAPAPAPDPAEVFKAPISARGTEPFWRIDVKGAELVRTGPEGSVTATNAGFGYNGGKAVWTAQAGMTPVALSLTAGECSDGMSDLKYPYTADVKWGDENLKGCGFLTADEPKEAQ